MSKINRFLIILFLLCNVAENYGQDSGDHLEPVGSIYDIYDFQFAYYSKVRKVLFEGLTNFPEIRFQVMPSFTPENVLDIEYDTEKGKYYLVYHICEKMIWYNEKWDEIKVDKYRTQIDEESVELIKTLFDIVISQSRFFDEETIGFDGTNYYFSIKRNGLKSGTVWSPSAGTKISRLIEIGYELIKLAKSEKELVKIDIDLQKKIENLIDKLK